MEIGSSKNKIKVYYNIINRNEYTHVRLQHRQPEVQNLYILCELFSQFPTLHAKLSLESDEFPLQNIGFAYKKILYQNRLDIFKKF